MDTYIIVSSTRRQAGSLPKLLKLNHIKHVALSLVLGVFSGFIWTLAVYMGTNGNVRVTDNGPTNLTSIKAFVIKSGSMAPKLAVGSLAVVFKESSYKKGDIITFYQSGRNDHIVTHRFFDETIDGIITKGDANEDPDGEKVKKEDIVGRVYFTVPYLGYLADFAKQPRGFILLVIIPATIIIYEELKSLLKELKNISGKLINRFSFRLKKREIKDNSSNGGFFSWRIAAIIIPILGTIMLTAAFSRSFFSDNELSLSNILGASNIFPTPVSSPTPIPLSSPTPAPIADTLVINEVLPDSSCFSGETEAQWIEIYNGYSTTIDLKNYQITDGSNVIDVVSAVTNVAPGDLVLLSHNGSIWNVCYSDNGADTVNLGGTLDIDTGTLQLLQPSSPTPIVIDTVQWGNTGEPNPLQDESIEREPDGVDSVTGTGFSSSDFVVRSTPQPGL